MELRFTRTLLPGMFLDYDCVIVPKLGGFICNQRSAWYDAEKEEMVPPSRDVLFNPNLTHNDGLLAQEVMRVTGCAYSEAIKEVESEASKMLDALKSGRSVEIQQLGRLYLGEDTVIRFLPDPELVRMLHTFGHSRIPLSPLVVVSSLVAESAVSKSIVSEQPFAEKTQSNVSIKKAPKVITMRARIIRVAAAIAIPLAIGGTWVLTESDSKNTLMSILPNITTDLIISEYTPTLESDFLNLITSTDEELSVKYELKPTLVKEELGEEIVTIPVSTEIPILTEAAEAAEATEAAEAAAMKFLIVGGAFSIKANANKLASMLESEGYSPIHYFQTNNSLHLVALSGFSDENEARRALNKARATGRKATWLKRL